MNIIFVSNRRGAPRKLDLKRPTHLLGLLAALAVPLSLVFGIGYYYAVGSDAMVADAGARQWRSELQVQAEQIADAKQRTQEDITALGIRIGEIRAHVIRLDALGTRLVNMAGLDDGEFDFGRAPPVGGPEHRLAPTVDASDFLAALDQLEQQVGNREQQLGVIEDLLLVRRLQEQVHPEGRPVESGWISSYFGRRSDPFTGRTAHHEGVDFAGRDGAPIYAVGAGVITWSGDRYGYGELVEINHGNGYITRYGHNSINLVGEGETVEKGQLIARMGSTGRATGPNLHFEVHRNGRPVDPLQFIAAAE